LNSFNGHTSGWLEKEDPFDLFNQNQKVSGNEERFSYGTGNDMSVVLANAVMDFRSQFGEEKIYERVYENALYLKKELKKMGVKLLSRIEDRSGIVTFYCKNASHLCEQLLQKGVVVRDRGENLLRVSPHYYNNQQDLEIFLKEVKQLEGF